ncbi:hypothetical protein LEMLEM_LOCUS12280 [Lemmus lemmus]
MTAFLAGCSTFTKDGGCSQPSGEWIAGLHRQLRITDKCHLDEQFPRGSKDTLKLPTAVAKPFNFNSIAAKPQVSGLRERQCGGGAVQTFLPGLS